MQYKCIINTITCWSSLPWQKIYHKIAIIQYKIYKLSVYYSFNKVHKLQKYLLNSNEAKLIAIKQVIDKIYLYYKSKSSNKILISNQQKFDLLKNLYNSKIKYDLNLYYLAKQVKQYIIFLSIKPELQAKFFYNFNNFKKLLNYIKYINKYNCINNSFYFINNFSFDSFYWYKKYQKKLLDFNKKINYISNLKYLISFKHFNIISSSLYCKTLLNYMLKHYKKSYSNKIFYINYLLIIFINSIKINYKKFNAILFYRFKKKYYNKLYKKYLYSMFNNKNINKIFYILHIQYIYNTYCI